MFPTLVSLGPVRISSFGVMVVIAFLLGAFMVWRQGREAHLDEEKLFDAVLVSVWWGIIGGRLVYGLEHWGEWSGILSWLNLTGYPGMSLWGAVVAGSVAWWWFSRQAGWQVLAAADVATPGLMLALAVGWGGAFLNGVGYGRVTSLPWGVRFPGLEGVRHPLQLYSLVGCLVLVWLTLKLEREYRTYEWYQVKRGEALPGFVWAGGMIGLGLLGVMKAWLAPATVVVAGMAAGVWQWLTLVVVGVVALYSRSGRSLGEDWLGAVRKVSGLNRVKRRKGIKAGNEVKTYG